MDEYTSRYPNDNPAQRTRQLLVRQPRCFERDCFDDGHVTGAAWLMNTDCSAVLLTHHVKLNKWLQLGGHSDGHPVPLEVAIREAEEESGLVVEPVHEEILDIDIHLFPARGNEPQHLHYDIRFLLKVKHSDDFRISSESNALSWVRREDVVKITNEPSILRMAVKANYTLAIGRPSSDSQTAKDYSSSRYLVSDAMLNTSLNG